MTMKTVKTYELTPTDSRKSFYGKCRVEVQQDGSEILMSYNTPIIQRLTDGTLKRLWAGWSATTGRHIAAFCGLNKKEFEALSF